MPAKDTTFFVWKCFIFAHKQSLHIDHCLHCWFPLHQHSEEMHPYHSSLWENLINWHVNRTHIQNNYFISQFIRAHRHLQSNRPDWKLFWTCNINIYIYYNYLISLISTLTFTKLRFKRFLLARDCLGILFWKKRFPWSPHYNNLIAIDCVV